jgi:hypothetical protein
LSLAAQARTVLLGRLVWRMLSVACAVASTVTTIAAVEVETTRREVGYGWLVSCVTAGTMARVWA